MPLKTYTKTVSVYASRSLSDYQQDYFIPKVLTYPEIPEQQVTMWSFFAGFYSNLKSLVASSSVAGLVIPTALILSGGLVIYNQVQPAIVQQVKESVGYYNQGTTSLVQDSYLPDPHQYVSNPGADYFADLSAAVQKASLFKPDSATLSYSGTMYLTIPALGFHRLPISPNVESTSREAYDQILQSSLAHFKGSDLPISGRSGNTVIYGHSASGNYHPRTDDVLAAFSFLSDLQIGDEIILEAEGVEHQYRMMRSKIVEPDDVSIIAGTAGKESLTLFTCYPNGNNSHRYVAVAVPVT